MQNVKLGMLLSQVQRLVTPRETRVHTDAQLLERFVRQRDEIAFAALLQRHGALVWRVCLHRLKREHDAEDAFQATFLVLARKAPSIRKAGSLASWLHGTALRVAMNAKRDAGRRHFHEGRAVPKASSAPGSDLPWPEVQAALDEEVQRLPANQREAFVLCVFEGKSLAVAAAQLGWKEGSVSGTLARARQRLRRRLAARGITLSALLTGMTLARRSAAAAAPLRATLGIVLGDSAGVPPAVLTLAQGAMNTMFSSRLTVIVTLFLAIVVATGAGAVVRLAAPPANPSNHNDQPAEREHHEGEKQTPVDGDGDPLPPGVLARLGTNHFRQEAKVQSLRYSRDGSVLVSTGDRVTNLWETRSGKQLCSIPLPDADRPALAISDDGKLFATATTTNVSIFEVASGKKVLGIEDVGKDITALAFSSDGKVLARTSGPTEIALLDVATGKDVKRLNVPQRVRVQGLSYDQLSFSADGKVLILAGVQGIKDGIVIVDFVEVAENKLQRSVVLGGGVGPAFFQRLAPDNKTMAIAGTGVYSLKDGKELQRLPISPYTSALDYSADGKYLVMCTGADGVSIWDVTTGKKVDLDHLPKSFCGAAVLAPDGKTLALAGDNAVIRVVDVKNGTDVHSFKGHRAGLYRVVLSPDAKTAATIGEDNSVRIWDVSTTTELQVIQGPEKGNQVNRRATLAFSPDAKQLAVAWTDNSKVMYDAKTGKESFTIGEGEVPAGASSLAFSADGKQLATACYDGVIYIWNARTGKSLHRYPEAPREPVAGDSMVPNDHVLTGGAIDLLVAFSPDGRLLLSLGTEMQHDGRKSALVLRVRELVTGKARQELLFADLAPRVTRDRFKLDKDGVPVLVTGSPHQCLVVSGDSRYAAVSVGTSVSLVDLCQNKEIRAFGSWADVVSPAAFSPDASTLAAGTTWGCVRFWSVINGTELGEFHGHRGPVTSVAYAADGKTLASGGADTTSLIWDVPYLMQAIKKNESKPSESAFQKLADDLASDDAERAGKAVRTFARWPKEAMPMLTERLRPVPPVDSNKLNQLVRDLNSEDFNVRSATTNELEQLGELAEPVLEKRLEDKPDLEVQRRIEHLLERLQHSKPSPERLRQLRTIEILEHLGTPEARTFLEKLSTGAEGARMTQDAKAALARLQLQSR